MVVVVFTAFRLFYTFFFPPRCFFIPAVQRPQPWSVSSASSVESVTLGGEVGFVRRLIESSLVIRDRVAVYTTMLGKQSSISPLKIFLKR